MTVTYTPPAPLTVAITSPPDGTVVNATPVSVAGTVSDPAATVTIDSYPVTLSGTAFQTDVPLLEGLNTITAAATDSYNQTATHNISITLLTKGTVSGTVTDSASGTPLPAVNVVLTDAVTTLTTITDAQGRYAITGASQGGITVAFDKPGYVPQIVAGTLGAGQALTLSTQLAPAPPLLLTVTSPTDGMTLYGTPLAVTGTVSNNAQVTVNGVSVAVGNGSFSASVHLAPGPNIITINAADQYHQTSSRTVTVTFTPMTMSAVSTANLDIDSAVLQWTTDQPASSLVEYGETATYGSSIADGTLKTTHSVALQGLKPATLYHCRVTATNGHGYSVSSDDFTFTTPQFTVKTVGDFGNIAVMEITGNFDAKQSDGTINSQPRREIAREYFKSHPDQDFLVLSSIFDYELPEAGAEGFYLEVKNDIQGIGKPPFDNTSSFGSPGRLQGTIDLGNLTPLASAPYGPMLDRTLTILGHELTHRFGVSVRFKNPDCSLNSALLGKDDSHWSWLLDSKGSIMYGNGWQDNGNGTFTSTIAMSGFSPLDLYLMGMIPKEQVPPMLLIDNPAIDKNQLPQLGATVTGTARTVTIDEIIAAEGARIPDSTASQKNFKLGYILLIRPGDDPSAALPAIETLRTAFAGRFADLTGGKGGIEEVPPTLNVYIESPADGATITGPDVTVTGAFINSTGAETGITVNGMPSTVSGSRFNVSHVPLQEGNNMIAVTATDVNGLTATITRSVTAKQGNYLRIVPNVDSGTAPLDLSLSLEGSFTIANPTISTSGPVPVTPAQGENPKEFIARLTFEGTYTFTASATGPDGQTYSDAVTISVMSKSQLENLLKAKWEGMKQKIATMDVEGAVQNLAQSSKSDYRDAFTAAGTSLPLLNNYLFPIELVYATNDRAKFRMMRQETVMGQTEEIEYVIYFIKENGIWKLRKF